MHLDPNCSCIAGRPSPGTAPLPGCSVVHAFIAATGMPRQYATLRRLKANVVNDLGFRYLLHSTNALSVETSRISSTVRARVLSRSSVQMR